MSKSMPLSVLCKVSLLALAAVLLAACAPATPDGEVGEPTATLSTGIPIEDLLVYVPAGSFYMGSDQDADPLAEEDEVPLHNVLLPGFFIYRNEVSNGLYKQCVAAGVCSNPEIFDEGPSTHYDDPAYAEYPVVGVNWDQANAFCSWANSRLPTEAEWEKAARGELGNLYPWGDDSPSCSLSNMAGCITDPPDTDEIGQYPGGDSFYEAGDMSGNVWEWTSDNYLPDYYSQSPDVNPLGPESGDLRVVRGGSYDSNPEDLRAAARMGLDPNEAYNNVGFRCVPLGVEAPITAAFCQPSYVPLCRDPNRDPNDDCTPPTVDGGQPTDGDFELTGFGCPDANGQVNVTVDGPVGDDNTVTVGGYEYNCVESTEFPGRWLCKGPHPPQGTLTTVTVCPVTTQGANPGNSLVAYQPVQQGPVAPQLQGYAPAKQDNGNQLVAYAPPEIARPALQGYAPPSAGSPSLVAYQSVTNTACPQGYILNPTTGQCEQDPNGACPEGWTYNTETNQCEPGDSGCPEGTTLSATAQGCTPDNGQECPDGFTYLAASNTCEPPANDDGGGACPAGYFFDQTINCCSPIVDDGCDPGSYRSAATNECMPTDEDGCQDGYSYNRYEGACVPDRGDGDNQTTEDGCDEGYVMNDAGQCVPGDTTTVQRTLNTQCAEGGYWDANLLTCVYPGDGQCGPGYYRSAASNTCVPSDGPGSGCPIGYAYSQRVGCCVETPGNDGSVCPGDDGQTGGLITFAAAPTNYDYGQGYCDPPEGEQCPTGYMFDGQGCVPIPTDGLLQTTDGCPEGTTYDYQLGYCVQDSCGCPLGSYMNTDTQECVPYGDQTTEGGCWTYTVSVPVCQGVTPTPHPECDRDEKWNPATLKCEREPDEPTGGGGTPGGGGAPACSSYGDQNSCKAAGCSWTPTGTHPNYGYCS